MAKLASTYIYGTLGVQGNIIVTGTVDGIDIASFETDYETTSGDYVDTSGMVNDYPTVSGVAASALQNVVEDLTPTLGGNLDANNKDIININDLRFLDSVGTANFFYDEGSDQLLLWGKSNGSDYSNIIFKIYNGSAYKTVLTETHTAIISAHHIVTAINDTPADAETTTGVSSNWAYDHLQEYNATSGAIADYDTVSGAVSDYPAVSGIVADYPTVSGDFSEVSGDFSEVSGDFAAGGAGDNLGSHEATQMLDMNTYKITGLGDGTAATHAMALGQKYSDANARGAISNVIGSDGKLDAVLDFDGWTINNIGFINAKDNAISTFVIQNSFTTDHYRHGTEMEIPTNGGAFGVPMYSDTTANRVSVCVDTAITTMPCIGIYIQNGVIFTQGTIRDDTWNFLIGKPVYVNGSAFSTTIPGSVGDIVQVVGVSITADSMYFNPSPVWGVRK